MSVAAVSELVQVAVRVVFGLGAQELWIRMDQD